MWVLFAIFVFVVLSLAGFRLHTHLAVHERRVVGAWDRLDTLLTQRNGQLHQCYRDASSPERLETLHHVLQDQETSRRRGDLPGIAQAERRIRQEWDLYISQLSDYKEEAPNPLARTIPRVSALDRALNEVLARYNHAVQDYTVRRRAFGLLARLAGFGSFQPLAPPVPAETDEPRHV